MATKASRRTVANKQVSEKTKKTPRVRKLQPVSHKSFRLSKKLHKLQKKPIAGVITLIRQTLGLFKHNKKLFLGIVFVQIILAFVFVQGFGSLATISDLKHDVQQTFGEDLSSLTTSVALFGYMISSVSTGNQGGETYQVFLTLVTSLAIIWAIRQVMAGQKISIRDAYYKGIYPLVPFVLILFVIGIQLIPALIGNLLYSTVSTNDLAVTAAEKAIWLLILALLVLLSAYMILSSLFALYIVTLPDMTPMQALRSARGLVLHRRIAIGLRLVVLPIVLLMAAAGIMIPLILLVPWAAQAIFLVLSGVGLFLIHAYLYNLYRALL